MPLNTVKGPWRGLRQTLRHGPRLSDALFLLILLLFAFSIMGPTLGFFLGEGRAFLVHAYALNGRLEMALLTPIYALLIAPRAALVLRSMVSGQREFLADADAALLTRDPQGLALALAKIGAATRASFESDTATAHLYFVGSSSQPSIDARISLLARMGDGIPERELATAVAAGIRYSGSDSDP